MGQSPTNVITNNAIMPDAMTQPPYPTRLRRHATQHPPLCIPAPRPCPTRGRRLERSRRHFVATAVRGQVQCIRFGQLEDGIRHHRPPQHLSRTAQARPGASHVLRHLTFLLDWHMQRVGSLLHCSLVPKSCFATSTTPRKLDDLTQYANLGHALMQPPLENVTKHSFTSAMPGN
jgi:hypothetical protein